ncbi:MAG TPA: 6-carboxytetrahydropterin synthase QueD [Terriglobales bacterium]|nr:6-carboxytetrahydropterin synthase QueD [Terriglobales bacterium]
MFEVSVEESFAAGHALRGYRGKCENPHGHNYKVRITVTGQQLDGIGLLWDFKDLKSAMNQIIDRLDHQYLNDLEPFQQTNPSAENLAKYFYDETKSRLDQSTQGRVRIKNVQVWETDTTTATYFE